MIIAISESQHAMCGYIHRDTKLDCMCNGRATTLTWRVGKQRTPCGWVGMVHQVTILNGRGVGVRCTCGVAGRSDVEGCVFVVDGVWRVGKNAVICKMN